MSSRASNPPKKRCCTPRRNRSIRIVPCPQRIRSIQEHGLLVTAGFVLGFDTESENAADRILACAEENALPVAMVSLLTAGPLTQLTRRLAKKAV